VHSEEGVMRVLGAICFVVAVFCFVGAGFNFYREWLAP
jgi:hypothetical protein